MAGVSGQGSDAALSRRVERDGRLRAVAGEDDEQARTAAIEAAGDRLSGHCGESGEDRGYPDGVEEENGRSVGAVRDAASAGVFLGKRSPQLAFRRALAMASRTPLRKL